MPVVLFVVIPGVGVSIACGLGAWFFSRIALVFPAVAADKAMSFSESWRLTKAHQPEMFLAVILIPILTLLPAVLLRQLPYTFWLTSVLSALATVFAVTALSVAYKLIEDQANAP